MNKLFKRKIKSVTDGLRAFVGTLASRAEYVVKSNDDVMEFPEYSEVSEKVSRVWGVEGDENRGATQTIQTFRFATYCSGLAVGLVILIRYWVTYPTLFMIVSLMMTTAIIMVKGKKGEME